jgi:hypothetical protein
LSNPGRRLGETEESVMLEHVTKELFSQHVNTKFLIHHESSTVEVELIQFTDASTPGQDRFSLVFRGPETPFLVQRIYCFEHDQMGALDLFIVPIARDEDGLYYEAVFNRLVKKNEK